MENVTDALYMGFAVIVFVVALSLSIFSFSNVASTSQRIIDARDKSSMYTYVEPTEGTTRLVTVEDIIPTLYRAYYENYLIKFEDYELYNIAVEKQDAMGRKTIVYEPSNIIDLEGQKIGNHADADLLITSLLQGTLYELLANDTRGRFSCFQSLQIVSFYDTIKGKTFIEEVGLFYMEDRDIANNQVSDVNKTKKRIITYKAQ